MLAEGVILPMFMRGEAEPSSAKLFCAAGTTCSSAVLFPTFSRNESYSECTASVC